MLILNYRRDKIYYEMQKNYLERNIHFWQRKFNSPNVESFIFRLKPKILDLYISQKKKIKILDFGCGEGANLNYFIKKFGYDGYGVDISKESIIAARKRIGKQNKIKLISGDVKNTDDFFNIKFDLIMSIQVLYYFSNNDLRKRLISFNNMLKPNGHVFFTMMSNQNKYYTRFSNKKKNKDGLTFVNLSKDQKYFKFYKQRHKQETYKHYINFTKDVNDLKKKFKIFKPLNIGYYEGSLESLKDGGLHYTFFGKKK